MTARCSSGGTDHEQRWSSPATSLVVADSMSNDNEVLLNADDLRDEFVGGRGSRTSGPVQVLMWMTLCIYIVALVRHGQGFDVVVDGWLCAASQLLPALVVWLSVGSA